MTSSSLVTGGFMVAADEALEELASLTSFAIKPHLRSTGEEHVAFKGVSDASTPSCLKT